MLLLISLIITFPLAFFGKDIIKKHAKIFYIIFAILSIGIVYITTSKIFLDFPTWVRTWIWGLFANGAISTSLFVIVMFTGAFKKGSKLRKTLLPIRAELSILASILILGHNVAFGLSYFKFLFTRPEALPLNQLLASISSIIMILIMIPLFITSFYGIRKKMNAKTWKKLQRWAYLFYALIYVHVLLLLVPIALKGRTFAFITVIVYSIIFLTYAAMRISLALESRDKKSAKVPVWIVSTVLCVLVILISVPNLIIEVKKAPVISSGEISQNKNQASSSDESSSSDVISTEESESKTSSSDETSSSRPSEASGENLQNKEEEEPAKEEEPVKEETQEPSSRPNEDSSQEVSGENLQNKEEEEPAKEEEPVKEEEPAKEEPQNSSSRPSEASGENLQTEEPEPVKIYKDGTYVASAMGYNANISVQVTIVDDSIVDVMILEHSEDEPYATDAWTMLPRFVAAQSPNVAAVGGATVTCDAVKEAVRIALENAKN